MLEIQDLHVRFHGADHEAVRGIDLRVEDGEIVGLVGESGSGKTVTAMVIAGLLGNSRAQIRGKILLDGVDLLRSGVATIREVQGKDICVVFQEPMSAMDPVMPIGPQVEECLLVHTDMKKKQRRELALQAMREADLPNAEELWNKYPHELSGGMLQRVMIAAAILPRPKLLLADEPTTALDVTIQAQILELMKDLQKKENTSIIFITHNLGVVAEICDRVSVMYAGRIVEQGLVQDIFYRPQHPYTKGLIASTPRLDEEDQERLVPIEGTPIDLLNPPSGCNFGPRCKNCMKICLREKPPYAQVGEGHISACWLHFMNRGSREAAGTGKENTANE